VCSDYLTADLNALLFYHIKKWALSNDWDKFPEEYRQGSCI